MKNKRKGHYFIAVTFAANLMNNHPILLVSLPEAYLELNQISAMEHFCENN